MTDEAIFSKALEISDAAVRSAYLDVACDGDSERRRRVDALLAAHARAGNFLEPPTAAPSLSDRVTRAPDPASDEYAAEEPIDFLEPPMRADSLGRLGHYEVLQLIGRGGFGIVFRAFDDVLQRVVAIKVMSPRMATTSPARKRFVREARGYAAVQHENVVQVYSIESEPLPYLVMEFISGESLESLITRTGPLDAEDVVRIGVQIAHGLAAAHEKGIIHRDIKPANILIENGPNRRVKITDFGLARTTDDASLTQSGMIAGTPLYMAPEQANGKPLDHRADLFSFGSVLYALCTGHPPFRAANSFAVLKRVIEDTPRPIREVIPEIPPGLSAIIEKLHEKEPGARIQTATEVADLLSTCLTAPRDLAKTVRLTPPATGTDASKGIEPNWPELRKPCLRPWAALGRGLFVALGLLALGGAVAFGIYQFTKAPTNPSKDDQTQQPQPQPDPKPKPVEKPATLAELLTSPDWEWSAPENLGPNVNTSGRELGAVLTSDELVLVFARNQKVWIGRRASIDEPFGKVEQVESTTEPMREDPSISGDGLVLVFSSLRDGKSRVLMCTRKSRDEPFGAPEELPEPVNGAAHTNAPVLSADALTLLVTSVRGTGKDANFDIVMFTRKSRDEPFGTETTLPPVNSPFFDLPSWISDDRRVLVRVKMEKRPHETRFHVRGSADEPFGAPRAFGALAETQELGRPWLSPDGMRMYFHTREVAGGHGELDLWMVRRVPKKK